MQHPDKQEKEKLGYYKYVNLIGSFLKVHVIANFLPKCDIFASFFLLIC